MCRGKEGDVNSEELPFSFKQARQKISPFFDDSSSFSVAWEII